MPKITVLIKQRKCFLIVQLEIVDLLFWNSLDKNIKHCKTTKHFRNQLKSVLLSEYNWVHFGACLVCSFVFLSVCMWSVFASHCIFVETFVKGMIVSGLYDLLITSSISCFVFEIRMTLSSILTWVSAIIKLLLLQNEKPNNKKQKQPARYYQWHPLFFRSSFVNRSQINQCLNLILNTI